AGASDHQPDPPRHQGRSHRESVAHIGRHSFDDGGGGQSGVRARRSGGPGTASQRPGTGCVGSANGGIHRRVRGWTTGGRALPERSRGRGVSRAGHSSRWTIRVIQRVFSALVVGTVIVGLACVDMSAPAGPASISNLRLPSPSVVVGDTMRDSLGQVAPLTILAFSSANDTIAAAGAQFFITDTVKAAHLAAGTKLVGDKIGSTVVLGQIGKLQTATINVPVTFKPDHMVKVSTDSVRPAFLP